MEKNKKIKTLEDKIENIDLWVKDFKKDLSFTKDSHMLMESTVNETIDNANHNYELIQEMKGEILNIKEQLVALNSILSRTVKRQIKSYNKAH